MNTVIRVAGAYIGIIVGAGAASGQEIIQYFTSFGLWGVGGSILTIILFPFLGYQIVKLGERLRVPSHKKVVLYLCGKYLGPVIDVLLAFFLFGVGVVMVAGSGSLFQQQFGIPPAFGYMLLVSLIILTLILSTKNVIAIISYITPYMFVLTLIVVAYSLFIADYNFNELENIALNQLSAEPHWLLSSLNYSALIFASALAMMAVIGATEENKKSARMGAVVGGIALGVLILILNLGIYVNIDQLQHVEMPTLLLATEISPILGILMAIAFLGMIFNTAVAQFYSFTARFVQPETPKFRIAVAIVGIVAFSLSFVGFVDLVNIVYPLLGYVGLILIASLFIALFRSKKQTSQVDTKGL